MSSKQWSASVLALVVLLGQSGCYTTRVVAPGVTEGQDFEDRQWFTLGGLVRISDPGGRQCPGGYARAESELSFVDFLISAGVALGGGLLGAVACAGRPDSQAIAACATFGSSLAPFLISPRTARFACIAGPAKAGAAKEHDVESRGAPDVAATRTP
ncbi:MAG: hypothetical protein L0Y66_04905 [Myxococcaceae bacterium]|nr:hypothetical protein [Myxococcaceae bacterium]MCI0670233.1 hypothetical protein [Myxococcaceae bacterium]